MAQMFLVKNPCWHCSVRPIELLLSASKRRYDSLARTHLKGADKEKVGSEDEIAAQVTT